MAAHPSANSAEGWGTHVRGWERVGHPPGQLELRGIGIMSPYFPVFPPYFPVRFALAGGPPAPATEVSEGREALRTAGLETGATIFGD
jgi:hypothetical protein